MEEGEVEPGELPPAPPTNGAAAPPPPPPDKLYPPLKEELYPPLRDEGSGSDRRYRSRSKSRSRSPSRSRSRSRSYSRSPRRSQSPSPRHSRRRRRKDKRHKNRRRRSRTPELHSRGAVPPTLSAGVPPTTFYPHPAYATPFPLHTPLPPPPYAHPYGPPPRGAPPPGGPPLPSAAPPPLPPLPSSHSVHKPLPPPPPHVQPPLPHAPHSHPPNSSSGHSGFPSSQHLSSLSSGPRALSPPRSAPPAAAQHFIPPPSSSLAQSSSSSKSSDHLRLSKPSPPGILPVPRLMNRPPAEFFVRTLASTWQQLPAPLSSSEQKPGARRLRVNGHLPNESSAELPKDPRGPDYVIRDSRIMVDEGIWLFKTTFKKDENWFAPRQGGIWLSGLSGSSDEQFLRDEFSRFGSLEQVQVFYHPDTGRHMGIATVRFSTETQARRAMKEMDNRTLYGARVQIKWDPFGLLGHSAFEKALQEEKKAAQAKAKALQSPASGSGSIWTDRVDAEKSRGPAKEKEKEQETEQQPQQQPSEEEMYSPSQAGFDDEPAPAPVAPTPMSISAPPPVAAPSVLYPPIPPNALPLTPARPTAPPVVSPPPGQPPRQQLIIYGEAIPTLQVQRFAQTQAELERLFTAFQPSRIWEGNPEGGEWFVEFPTLQHRDRAFTLLNAIVHAGRRLQLYVYDRNFRTEAPKERSPHFVLRCISRKDLRSFYLLLST